MALCSNPSNNALISGPLLVKGYASLYFYVYMLV